MVCGNLWFVKYPRCFPVTNMVSYGQNNVAINKWTNSNAKSYKCFATSLLKQKQWDIFSLVGNNVVNVISESRWYNILKEELIVSTQLYKIANPGNLNIHTNIQTFWKLLEIWELLLFYIYNCRSFKKTTNPKDLQTLQSPNKMCCLLPELFGFIRWDHLMP